ncbi:hypothetical protein SCORR_v1c08190 [Spiroplasma corruscae]|uniref:Uncharacterized protein n=1 Tax=Spiroplasma corruscae TaxID=216934 RepID=A0A222EQC2_9MOLU|nr:hypothetical protein [Spiroplasma corruscae]ASP28591.1 hypothetical protein SCORR_v1c08190 [Spiroplasma corruscae]
MGFKQGVIVNYNKKNYLIVEVIDKQLTDRQLTFLRLKDLITQEVITVDSKMVKSIVVNKNNNNPSQGDTEYIDSLFDFKSYRNTDEDLFDLSMENTISIDDINSQGLNGMKEDRYLKNKELENYNLNGNKIVESFLKEKTQPLFKPRRKPFDETQSIISSNNLVDQTFSSLKTSEYYRNQVNEESIRGYDNSIDSQSTNRDNLESFAKNNFIQNEKENNNYNDKVLNIDKEQIDYNNQSLGETNKIDTITNNQNYNKLVSNNDNNHSFVLHGDYNLSDLEQIINDSKKQNQGEDENYITIDKSLLNNKIDEENNEINSGASVNTLKYTDPNLKNLVDDKTETGSLDTHKLNAMLIKQENILDELNKKDINETNTIYGLGSNFNRAVLKESSIYKKFNIMSIWLILLFVFTIISPVVILIVKFVYLYLESSIISMSYFKLFTFDGLIIADYLLVTLCPLLFLVFLVYLLSYLVYGMKIQYKKVAYQNYMLESKLKIIDSIQEFNAETSTYLIKVHNDIKKIKTKFKKYDDTNPRRMSSNSNSAKKVSH